jgi:hypothetical protein
MLLIDDKFGIPVSFFGPLDPELPELIGRVVMLSTLLELKLANFAGSIDNGTQHSYLAVNASTNMRVARARLRLYGDNDVELDFVKRARPLLTQVKRALDDRNEIVHRIWPEASATRWAGWKAKRHVKTDETIWTDWADYSRIWFVELVTRLIALIDDLSELVAFAGGLPRRFGG